MGPRGGECGRLRRRVDGERGTVPDEGVVPSDDRNGPRTAGEILELDRDRVARGDVDPVGGGLGVPAPSWTVQRGEAFRPRSVWVEYRPVGALRWSDAPHESGNRPRSGGLWRTGVLGRARCRVRRRRPADIYCEPARPSYKAGAQAASCLEDGFSTPSGSCEACQVDAPGTAWFGAGHCVHLVKRTEVRDRLRELQRRRRGFRPASWRRARR